MRQEKETVKIAVHVVCFYTNALSWILKVILPIRQYVPFIGSNLPCAGNIQDVKQSRYISHVDTISINRVLLKYLL
jgi:hypothetical protein